MEVKLWDISAAFLYLASYSGPVADYFASTAGHELSSSQRTDLSRPGGRSGFVDFSVLTLYNG